MIDVLDMVKQAAARMPLIPGMDCFHFYGGRVQCFNGVLCIDAPLELFDRELVVNAAKFYKAAKMCKGEFKHNITPKGKLSISKNKFRALIALEELESFPRLQPGAGISMVGAHILEVLKLLRPFVSEDTSRPWSRSVLFRDGYAYATNNIAVGRVETPPALAELNMAIPVLAVDALLEQDEEIATIHDEENAICFFFSGQRWMRINKIDTEWPDVSKMIVPAEMDDLPPFFVEAIENTIPFCDDPKLPVIRLGEYGVATVEGTNQANIDIGEFSDCVFRAEPLLIVARHAHSIAFSSHPKPCYFEGDNTLTGMIVGMS